MNRNSHPKGVFVYGTLKLIEKINRWGIPLEGLLGIKLGTIQAELYDLGPYPGIIHSDEGEVHGEFQSYSNMQEIVKLFDRIEGYAGADDKMNHYNRELVEVTLEDGTKELAWAYFYNREEMLKTRGTLVENGMWRWDGNNNF